jgi:uncharacterized repeat protein (TIGR01451 family)
MTSLSYLRKAVGAASAVLAIAITSFLPLSTAHAAPAAGTVIGNQASATYTDGSGASRTTTSNLVQTTVSQVKSFTLTADGARTAAGGQTVYYPHVITNLGNGVDTYALNAATTGGAFAHTGLAYYADANGDGVPDNSVALTSTGPLAAGAQFRFVVAAVVPAGAALGQTGTIIVKATDTAATVATNTDTTTVSNSAVTVTKSMSVTSGPSPSAGAITVNLAYANTGTQAASTLTLGDALPAGMTYVAGSARWSTSGATALSDAGTGNPAGIAFDYGVTTAGKVTAIVSSVAAGSSAQLSFQVTIAAGLSPTNTALGTSCTAAGCPALTTNGATYSTSVQAVTSTNNVMYNVVQAGSVVLNGSGASSVNGTGEPLVVASAAQGAVVSFTTYAWNLGNGSDTLNISTGTSTFPAGTTFQLFKADGTTPLLDTNGDGIADTGPVAAGGSFTVVVKANLPTNGVTGNNAGAGFTATVTATSVFSPGTSDTAVIKLSAIGANTVDLTADLAVATATVANGLGATGTTVVSTNNVTPSQGSASTSIFKVFVNNTGTAVDSYDLSLQTALPSGWSLSFASAGGANNCSTLGAAITNTGSVAGGANKLVCAVVTVPSIVSGAVPGNVDFVVKAQSASTAASNDTVGLRVAVQTVHSVTLSPNGMQQTYAASAVTYVHVLTNIGNIAETVSFPAGFLTDSQQAAGWTSSAYIDSNANGALDIGTDVLLATGSTLSLNVGESKTLFVRVFAPASATTASPSDVASLVATYSATSVSATDTTGITDGLLLLKEQTLTGCAVPNPHTGYSSAAIAAGAGTAPGQCVSYRITATNTTSATITNVQMSDTVPANTVLYVACGAPTGSAGVTMGGTATDGATGTITASAASLAPTASMNATFCVRINP